MTSIEFGRLVDVPVDDILTLLNEPKNSRHMPLAAEFSHDEATQWAQQKDDQWNQHGYGPWAVFIGGSFAGWAGFQHEEDGADFGLVLLPKYWGHGLKVSIAALDRGFGEIGLDEVVIALPFSRNPTEAVARLGFVPDGEVTYGEASFRQYRLTRSVWSEVRLQLLAKESD